MDWRSAAGGGGSQDLAIPWGIQSLRTGHIGACFIDTAESYSTEEVVGRAIQGIRKDIFLATKVSPRHFRCAGAMAAAERSLKQLNTDYVDLYQLHWQAFEPKILNGSSIRSHRPGARRRRRSLSTDASRKKA